MLDELVGVFRRGLPGDPLARIASMRLKWKSHTQLHMPKPRPSPPEMFQWLSQQMERLEWTGVSNPHAVFASVAMVMPKGD